MSRGHDLLATVTVVAAEFVRWRGWHFDAKLREPARLAHWLRDRGLSIE